MDNAYIYTVRIILHFRKLTNDPREGLLESDRIRQDLRLGGNSVVVLARGMEVLTRPELAGEIVSEQATMTATTNTSTLPKASRRIPNHR